MEPADFIKKHPRWTSLFIWITYQVSKPWAKFILIPIIYGLPVFFINSSFGNSSLAEWLSNNFGIIGKFIVEKQAWIIIFSFILYAIISYFFSIIKEIASYQEPPPPELKKEYSMFIIQTLESIVSAKYNRFKDTLKSSIKSSETFTTITQPEEQEKLILLSLQRFFEFAFQEKIIKTRLMVITNNKCETWKRYLPDNIPPKTDIKILNSKTSTITRCIKNKSIILVEDVKYELDKSNADERNYIKGLTPEDEQGSQICYPILHPVTNEVVFVLAISINVNKAFKQDDLEFYKWLIGIYAHRLMLETALAELKVKYKSEITNEAA